MNFFQRINLNLRRAFFGSYQFAAALLSKTFLKKIRIGEKNLGLWVYERVTWLLYKNLPDPIETKGMILYHQVGPGKRGFGWLYNFDYEPETHQAFERYVQQGMTVADVGAHLGYFSLLSGTLVGKSGRVFAFEPDPEFHGLLQKNIAANGLESTITPVHAAVGNTETKARFFLGTSTSSSLFKLPDSSGRTVTTDVITLDSFFGNLGWPSIDLIKIDVDGGDRDVLLGMKHVVQRNQNLRLVVELCPPYLQAAGTSPEEFLAHLAHLGFVRIRPLTPQGTAYSIPEQLNELASLGKQLSCVNLWCERGS